MTKEEFVKLKDKYSKKWADAHFNSFKEYDWDKFIRVEDASTAWDSSRRKYALYKDNVIITPYLDETGNYKSYQGKDNILMAQYAEFDSEGDYNNFYSECQKDISTRWNIWEFVLYPSGEYESSFIWDNEAYLEEFKKDAKGFFNLIHQEIESCDAFFDADDSFIPWEDIIVIISFKSGKVEPLRIEIKSGENIIYHTEPIGDEYGEYRYQVSKQRYEDIYHLTNEGELKEKLSPKWNVATVHIKNGTLRHNFDFDRDVSFEWREENA